MICMPITPPITAAVAPWIDEAPDEEARGGESEEQEGDVQRADRKPPLYVPRSYPPPGTIGVTC